MKSAQVALCALVVFAATVVVRAEETRLPVNADSLNSAIEQMVGAVNAEQAAMAASMAAHDGPTRRLTQASQGQLQDAIASFASGLPNLGALTRSAAAATGGSSAAAAVSGGVAAAAAAAAAAPLSLLKAKAGLEAQLNEFCTPSEFTEAAEKPAVWNGQGFTLALIPHSCLIYPETKTLACSPAQIVLLKTPATWNQAYTSPATYTGKSCQLVQPLGESTTEVLGAAPYTVPIPASADPKFIIPKFNKNLFGAAPASAGSAAAAVIGK